MFPLLNRVILLYLLHPLRAKTAGRISAARFVFTTEQRCLHVFPAVGGEEQVNGVILQVLLLQQVGADQLPDLRGSLWKIQGNKEQTLP